MEKQKSRVAKECHKKHIKTASPENETATEAYIG
jgi:hypothetical protein